MQTEYQDDANGARDIPGREYGCTRVVVWQGATPLVVSDIYLPGDGRRECSDMYGALSASVFAFRCAVTVQEWTGAEWETIEAYRVG